MIGHWYELVIDCTHPSDLADFYQELLGMVRLEDTPDWITIRAGDHPPSIAFQKIQELRPPRWPDPEQPQQMHIDVMVDDLDVAEPQVLALGATLLDGSDKPIGFRVYADPAGHPFCLVTPESVAAPD